MTGLRVQVVVGGHPFDEAAFFQIFEAMPDIEWTSASTPSTGHDVVVFYDMPGFAFTGGDPPVHFRQPSPEHRQVLADLRSAGTGMVFLHHAIAGWPSWPEYAEVIGGRFHYQPAELRGVLYPDSGYLLDTEHEVAVVDPDHPVCRFVPPTFTITDELYCFPVFEDSVVPLMRTRYPVDDCSRFDSADRAIRRSTAKPSWSHPVGSDLVAWVKSAGASPVVYVQFGDGPTAFADANYRLILSNSVHWTGSVAAREWVTSTYSSE